MLNKLLLAFSFKLYAISEPTMGIEPILNSLPMNRFTTKLCRHRTTGSRTSKPFALAKWQDGTGTNDLLGPCPPLAELSHLGTKKFRQIFQCLCWKSAIR